MRIDILKMNYSVRIRVPTLNHPRYLGATDFQRCVVAVEETEMT
jgi:hypothetical protein